MLLSLSYIKDFMLFSLLSKRLHLIEIHEIISLLHHDNNSRKVMLELLIADTPKKEAINVAWVFTHLSDDELVFLNHYQAELIDVVMKCDSDSLCRLVLSLLHRLTLNMDVEFFEYCLAVAVEDKIPVGIRALSIKIAYQLCSSIPEMCLELQTFLQLMSVQDIPSVESAKNQILRKINKSMI